MRLKKNHTLDTLDRYLSRFFDRLAHETTYSPIGSRHLTYQDYQLSLQKLAIFLGYEVLKIKINSIAKFGFLEYFSKIFFFWKDSTM